MTMELDVIIKNAAIVSSEKRLTPLLVAYVYPRLQQLRFSHQDYPLG
jgi:hypothetical protein